MTSLRPGPVGAALLAVAVTVLGFGFLLPPAGAAEPEWNLDRIGAPATAPGVVIAVVDTGVDGAHPAFTGRVRPAIDLVGGRGGDPNGHGTHVAGVVAGADNGCGAIGVVPDAQILPVRVLEGDGTGTVDAVADGIRRAADEGAAVINLSLGTDVVLRNVSGSGLEDAIRYAWAKGSIPVLAAGNDGLFGGLFGSGYGDLPAVVVTATDHRDQAAPYATSIGSAAWGVAAPGGDTSGVEGRDILSAFPDRRCALHAGTSMAAPHVSGALAALRASGLPPRQAVERLLATARDLGSANTYGHGLVDLRAALGARPPATVASAAPSSPAPVPTRAPSPPSQPAPSTAPPTSSPTSTTAGRPVPTSQDAAPTTVGADRGVGLPTTTVTAPAGPEESAGPVVVRDIDGDGGAGLPGGVVAVAVAALATSAAGAVALGRSVRRRP